MMEWEHPAYAAVFSGQDIEAWTTILRHHEEFGKVPDVKVFRMNFPDGTYDLPVSRTTAPELVALARDAVNQFHTEAGHSEAARYIDAGDPLTAAQIMLAAAEKVMAGGPATRPFRMLSLEDIERLPDPEPLIDGLIDHGTVTPNSWASRARASRSSRSTGRCASRPAAHGRGTGSGKAGSSTSLLRARSG
jgi:hypothetical protein